jgi:hypothetical protein
LSILLSTSSFQDRNDVIAVRPVARAFVAGTVSAEAYPTVACEASNSTGVEAYDADARPVPVVYDRASHSTSSVRMSSSGCSIVNFETVHPA